MINNKIYGLLILGCLKILFVPDLHATVFDSYEDVTAESVWYLPEFSDDQWQLADQEAQKILSQWQTKPVTIPWTELTLAKFIKHKMQPSRGARALALIHVAMYDALHHQQATTDYSKISVSVSAALVLGYLFPAEEHAFLRIAKRLTESEAVEGLSDEALNLAINLGLSVGQKTIAYAQQDGAQRGWNGKRLQWYGEGRYYGPGSWEPTPPYFYYPPDEPFAPRWKPWVLSSPDQFRPEAPPLYGTTEFITALDEVIEVDKNLTDEQKRIAEFWVDGHGTVTPAGHWNQIAIDLTANESIDEKAVANIFMKLNVAMADTFIAAWESKYHYWFIRPVTAAKKIKGLDFKPHILTPPFPSYVSGHAATSGAAADVLAHFFPNDAQRIIEMGEQAAHSRLLGGIHFRFDNDQGLVLGRKIANLAIANDY
jgi:hypothetical protein